VTDHQYLSQFLLRAGSFSTIEEVFGELFRVLQDQGLEIGRLGLAIIPIYDSLDGIHLLTGDDANGAVTRLDRESGFFDSEEHRRSIIAHVMNTNERIRLNLAEGEGCSRYEFLNDLRERGNTDYLITPIGHQKTVRFILSVTTRRQQKWSEREIEAMLEFFTVMGYAAESFELSRMIFLASKDPLTRLLNRRAFDHEARKFFDSRHECVEWSAMIFFDIDKFKEVNDAHGHNFGDRVIADIARATTSVSREYGAICGRVGGEEFVLLLPALKIGGDSTPIELLFEQIRSTTIVHEPSGASVSVSISAGCLYLPPNTPSTYERAIKLSNALMHQAKKAGRDRYIEETLRVS
jgi:diguanylate cyclase (GGDEF)-like protein